MPRLIRFPPTLPASLKGSGADRRGLGLSPLSLSHHTTRSRVYGASVSRAFDALRRTSALDFASSDVSAARGGRKDGST